METDGCLASGEKHKRGIDSIINQSESLKVKRGSDCTALTTKSTVYSISSTERQNTFLLYIKSIRQMGKLCCAFVIKVRAKWNQFLRDRIFKGIQ